MESAKKNVMKVPAKNNAPLKNNFNVNFLLYFTSKAMMNPPIMAGMINVNALMNPAEAASELDPSSAIMVAVIMTFAW